MQKQDVIPDWLTPKELFLIWPQYLSSGVGTILTPFYKRLLKSIKNKPIILLHNTIDLPKDILLSNVFPLKINTGDIWLRDFMPIAIKNGDQANYHKFIYSPSYFSSKDEKIKQIGNNIAYNLPTHFNTANLISHSLVLDGGNFISNGKGTAITTNRIIADNQHFSLEELKQMFQEKLGIQNLIILPVEPGDITGHVDGMLRFINENTVLVADYPKSCFIGKLFMNKIAKSLANQGFDILRIQNDEPINKANIFPSACGNYINYLRLNNVIYLPIYKGKNKLNKNAIALFESLNFEVIPVFADELSHLGGVLNCISWLYY